MTFDCRSRKKRLVIPEPKQPAARFCAWLWNITNRPSLLMTGENELLLPEPVPLVLTLTSVVVSHSRSRTKTSDAWLVSPGTRSLAQLVNATNRPSPLMDGWEELPVPATPLVFTLTRMLSPASRSPT